MVDEYRWRPQLPLLERRPARHTRPGLARPGLPRPVPAADRGGVAGPRPGAGAVPGRPACARRLGAAAAAGAGLLPDVGPGPGQDRRRPELLRPDPLLPCDGRDAAHRRAGRRPPAGGRGEAGLRLAGAGRPGGRGGAGAGGPLGARERPPLGRPPGGPAGRGRPGGTPPGRHRDRPARDGQVHRGPAAHPPAGDGLGRRRAGAPARLPGAGPSRSSGTDADSERLRIPSSPPRPGLFPLQSAGASAGRGPALPFRDRRRRPGFGRPPRRSRTDGGPPAPRGAAAGLPQGGANPPHPPPAIGRWSCPPSRPSNASSARGPRPRPSPHRPRPGPGPAEPGPVRSGGPLRGPGPIRARRRPAPSKSTRSPAPRWSRSSPPRPPAR